LVKQPSPRRRRQRGNELIEFALVATLLLPLLFGTVVVGLNLGRSIQVTQVSRDTGHMMWTSPWPPTGLWLNGSRTAWTSASPAAAAW
jgi:hypothetical protein